MTKNFGLGQDQDKYEYFSQSINMVHKHVWFFHMFNPTMSFLSDFNLTCLYPICCKTLSFGWNKAVRISVTIANVSQRSSLINIACGGVTPPQLLPSIQVIWYQSVSKTSFKTVHGYNIAIVCCPFLNLWHAKRAQSLHIPLMWWWNLFVVYHDSSSLLGTFMDPAN